MGQLGTRLGPHGRVEFRVEGSFERDFDRRNLVLLQHARQLDLHARRNVAGFVEEQGRPIGQFQQSLP